MFDTIATPTTILPFEAPVDAHFDVLDPAAARARGSELATERTAQPCRDGTLWRVVNPRLSPSWKCVCLLKQCGFWASRAARLGTETKHAQPRDRGINHIDAQTEDKCLPAVPLVRA